LCVALVWVVVMLVLLPQLLWWVLKGNSNRCCSGV
jgi:hypothetical protein